MEIAYAKIQNTAQKNPTRKHLEEILGREMSKKEYVCINMYTGVFRLPLQSFLVSFKPIQTKEYLHVFYERYETQNKELNNIADVQIENYSLDFEENINGVKTSIEYYNPKTFSWIGKLKTMMALNFGDVINDRPKKHRIKMIANTLLHIATIYNKISEKSNEEKPFSQTI